ncbi:FAD dependent oxidoreductase [Crepidotus variabilis]|uniref:FAD dependent oxidoreductase n=1 Tax=Crepidotus variabilis TaxID=179855 RepID=A0A9P6ECW4_9AGAR|nr:FAD dependent oxidoreductase [Crepidotus variabilis]
MDGIETNKILPTPTPTNGPVKDSRIVIVGAGCFGLSTAHHLLLRGYTDVTVLDRSTTLPAPDAASNDLNRIVRSSYADLFYAELAREAISSWKDREKWGDIYDESGLLLLGLSPAKSEVDNHPYADKSYHNDVVLGSRLNNLPNGEAIREVFPPDVRTGTFEQSAGYLNLDSGWANAGKGLRRLMQHIETLNGRILPGKEVNKILRHSVEQPKEVSPAKQQAAGKISGVQCADGSIVLADLVVIATGSWTPSAFTDLDLGKVCLATGQPVAMIQLSKEEAEIYRRCPVILDFSSGFYIFPPNEDHIVKMAQNSPGYTHFGIIDQISTPRTITSDPDQGLCIPRTVLQVFRKHLKNIYPDLALKPFSATRLCWYTDTADEDWLIGRRPSDPSVVFATGGSGHAYKFLPVIGRLVADLIEGKFGAELEAKFAIDRPIDKGIYFRAGQAQRLDVNELCTPEDLLI